MDSNGLRLVGNGGGREGQMGGQLGQYYEDRGQVQCYIGGYTVLLVVEPRCIRIMSVDYVDYY